jgi:hypothetical protein
MILMQKSFFILSESFPQHLCIVRVEFSSAQDILHLGLCKGHGQGRRHSPNIRWLLLLLLPGESCGRRGRMVTSP